MTAEALLNLQLPQGAILPTILIANSPQIWLSSLYLSINSILTCMLLAEEWTGYAHQRKTLRVTSPTGKQRSTYRLHIPYSYGVSLLIMFGVLHWLVSQSLLLARVNVYDSNGNIDDNQSTSTCGYSLIATMFSLIVGAIIVLLLVATGFPRYKPGMPFVGSCSAAISAACHRPREDVNASKLPLKWGVVGHETNERTGDRIGHCAFFSFNVDTPIKGELYAGRAFRLS